MTVKERTEERKARIKEMCGADFCIKRNGKTVRSRKTYRTRDEWEKRLSELKRSGSPELRIMEAADRLFGSDGRIENGTIHKSKG